MKSNKNILIILLIFFVFTTFSCRSTYKIKGKTDNLRPVKLYENIIKNEFIYDNLSLKVSAEAMIDGKKESCSGIIRIQKDSVIWISLRAFTVEGARLCFTQDSIRFLNRLNNTYFVKDFQTFSKEFGMDIDYGSLQAMLTNNFFFHPGADIVGNEASNFKQCIDSVYYCMSSISKRKYYKYYSEENTSARWEKKLEKELKDSANVREVNDFIFQTIKVVPEIYRIHDIYLENYIQQQSMYVEYDKHIIEENQYFPRIIKVQFMTPYAELNLKLNVESVSLNSKSITFPFKISDKYQEIIFP